MAALLEVKSVDQIFRSGFWMRKVQVLHGVSLEVPERSVFGFLGANGAGKTTLIQLIVGLRNPTAGSICLRGRDAVSPEARMSLGYLPERPYFYEHLTGEAVLKYFGTLSGMKPSQLRSRIGQALKAVGMAHARHVELKKYSKGMLQRIGIAQAILHDPEFLVLDEPMSGLDPMGRKEMRELILQLAAEGRTIFFSSHVIPDVEAICDQVAIIRKGKILGYGPIHGFLAQQGETQVEVIFSGIPREQAERMGLSSIRELPDALKGVVASKNKLNEFLSAVIQARGEVQTVLPVRPTLESMFEKDEARNG